MAKEETPTENSNTQSSDQNNQKSNTPLLLVILVFICLVVVVFLTQKKESIDWITDYKKGVALAREQNKPLLLVFYTPNAPMYRDAVNRTYNNPEVKKYIESNFVPVLINCDQETDIAKEFQINYYPTHYVKHPDKDMLFGPRLGMDEAGLFIKEMQFLLDQLNEHLEN